MGSAALAQSQEKDVPPDLQEFYIYNGKCNELIFADKDFTTTCGPAVVLSKFESGRASLLFQQIKGSLVAFYGTEQSSDTNQREFVIDRVAENTQKISATGKCSITYAESTKASFLCSAQSDGKQYSAFLQSETKPKGFHK